MKFSLFCALLLLLTSCSQLSKTGYSGHGADSLSPKTIAKFAPKPVDSKKLARIEAMLDVRAPGAGLLSPDGKTLFFSWGVTGVNQIWKVSKNLKFPIQMTGGQDATFLRAISPNGKLLALSRDEKGNEYPSVYIQSVDGGPLIKIAGQKKVISSPYFFSHDSKYLYYSMNAKSPTQHDFYKVNLSTLKSVKVVDGIKGYMYARDHRRNGDILFGNATGNIAREYYLFNEKTKKMMPVLGQNESTQYDVSFGRRPGEYFVLTNKFGEFQRLYSYRNKKFTPISPKTNYNISNFDVDDNRTRILYTINKEGYSETKAMSAKNFRSIKTPFIRTKGILHVYAGGTTYNSRYTVFAIAKAKSPQASYVYDWRTGKKSQWVFPSSPEVNTQVFVEPKLEYYLARDKTKIPMFVSRPKQCTKKANCPVVVNFHGGPEAQSKPRMSAFVQLLLEEGFIFVAPNVRGSRGYGKSWLNSDNGPKRLNVITDIEDVALYIKKNWAVNGVSPKVGVMGGSYGGYSTNMAMTKFAGAYSAGVTIVGMSSLISFLENTGPFRRHLRVTEYGDPEKDKEALIKLSPITYLDNIKDPILLIHGATDPRVPAGEALQIYKAMNKKGLDGELILFPDEGHGVRKRKNRAIYISSILDFFNKHLK